ncbi:IGF-like family receptor 1 isoform X3 [Poecilia reticulata]|uniref:IGF-like family receptor 1 isoform X3 n=1 Tax=Poecilia reticulata TaxID=8081 RepID=UPI0004A3DDB4|nr:PREDICTED: IGF-like family receptor 1 isoform X3 [Poecilia reticulata]
MQKMGYSNICTDLTTFWNRNQGNCEPCDKKAGSEVENNCGRGDDGGIHTDTHKKCKPNTFNDGSQYYCRECSTCPPGTTVVKNCTSVSDIICQEIRNESTTTPLPKSITTHAATSLSTAATTQTYITTVSPSSQQAALCVCKKAFYRRRTSYQNEGFSPIQPERNSEVLCDMLNADILSAPLHKVLDDLDVLEELVILLDPDTQGIKSTKHLASHCSFPSTWITYTYSMKDTKSPLKAVLEGVTSKQPDWTVGHLAKLLRQMNRNDAISVLAKLRPIPKNFI